MSFVTTDQVDHHGMTYLRGVFGHAHIERKGRKRSPIIESRICPCDIWWPNGLNIWIGLVSPHQENPHSFRTNATNAILDCNLYQKLCFVSFSSFQSDFNLIFLILVCFKTKRELRGQKKRAKEIISWTTPTPTPTTIPIPTL